MFDVYTLFVFLFFYHLTYLVRGFCGHSYVFVFVILCCELHISYVHFIVHFEDPQPGLRCKTHHTVKSPRLFRYNTINRMECTIKLKIPFGIPKSCWIQKIPVYRDAKPTYPIHR